MTAPPHTEEAAFLAARRIADPVERARYLASLDGPLADRVAALLAVEDSFLGQPAPGLAPVGQEGVVAGPYKLLGVIGEGGFGTVYLAEGPDREPVAVKVVKPGMDSRQVLARFDAERHTLAILDHPHIARFRDAGTLPSGRPWFAMELVRGLAVAEFCDRERLTVAERIRILCDVCRAVEHAHQKGIIHRDLKSSNVLVTRKDRVPTAKVIDFGIAKALAGPLTDRTMITGLAQIVGTPAAMSPEQLDGSGDVDTRADIYALGVLAYELLTGEPPFRRDTLRGLDWAGVQRLVSDVLPPRPSTRVETLAGTTTVAANRRSDTRRLKRLLRGDLDGIVMKCLEKDRRRRYATAGDLARDFERHLAGVPVEARPPSVTYRVGRFLRRNRLATAAAIVAFTGILAGGAGTVWGLIQARAAATAERDRADAESTGRIRAEQAEAEAASQERKARDELAVATAVREFLQDDVIRQAGSFAQAERRQAPNPQLTLREALDRAAERVGSRFADRPAVEAGVRRAVGLAYRDVDQPAKAVTQLEIASERLKVARGENDLDVATVEQDLADALRQANQPVKAVPVLERVLRTREAGLGPDHRDTLNTQNALGLALWRSGRFREAGPMFDAVFQHRLRTVGRGDPLAIAARENQGLILVEAGEPENAIPIFREVVDLRTAARGENDLATLQSRMTLGSAYRIDARYAEAVATLRPVCEAMARALAPDHTLLLTARLSFVTSLILSGGFDEAERTLNEVAEVVTKGKGPDSTLALQVRALRASLLAGRGNPAAAFAELELVVARQRQSPGAGHPATLRNIADLGEYALKAGRPDDAIRLLEEAYRGSIRVPGVSDVSSKLFRAYVAAGRRDDAVKLVAESIAVERKRLPAESLALAKQLARHAELLTSISEFTAAEPLAREARTIREQSDADAARRRAGPAK